MKLEILSRFNSSVLFSVETESLKLAVELAAKQGAYLEGANLRGANLGGAKGLDKFPIQIPGHKHAMWTTQDGQLQIGCHKYSFDQWEKKAESIGKSEHYSSLDIEIYKLHIAHIAQVARLLWAKQKVEGAA